MYNNFRIVCAGIRDYTHITIYGYTIRILVEYFSKYIINIIRKNNNF